MRLTHRATMIACYNGYVTQAICINFAPLLYLTFQKEFGISVRDISLLIAVNFLTQLLIDALATVFSARLNLRFFAVLAHIASASGLVGLSFFPKLFPPYIGLLVSVTLLGIGGGFTEVIISPLMEACPTEGKSASMSFLHSFYCWGQVGVILLSGIFFAFFEIQYFWRLLPIFWALIPLFGAVLFSMVPIYSLPTDKNEGGGVTHIQKLFRMPIFFSFILMMLCAGASEMTMSQWSSVFAESALQVPKELGDLLGPCMFALMMGVSRLLYGKFSNRFSLSKMMLFGCIGCLTAYGLAALVPIPAIALWGCALCGLSVGMFWPGILSQAAEAIPMGGIPLFSILALAGDIGCLVGPSAAGGIADAMGGDLRYAFYFAMLFPAVCMGGLLLHRYQRKENEK